MARTARFFHDELPVAPGSRLELGGDEGRHGAQVLRIERGREVEVFDGRGGCGRFLVRDAGRDGLALELIARSDDDREAAVEVALAVALPKPKRLLSLVEKATELGAARFVPLATERTRPGGLKRAKLERRAIDAAKQCGRNRIPVVGEPLDVAALARERASFDLALFGDGEGKPLRDVARGATARSILVAVGPEGGFTRGEKTALEAAGFVPVALGRATLRVETAALALLACLRYELG